MRGQAKIGAVGFVIGLTACTTYWNRPGATDADLRRDAYECERDARQSQFANVFFMIAFQERCMMARGWTKASR
jgi:hypothetical protein